jgi:hypothetical protein
MDTKVYAGKTQSEIIGIIKGRFHTAPRVFFIQVAGE